MVDVHVSTWINYVRECTMQSSEIDSKDNDEMDFDFSNQRNVEVKDTAETQIPVEDVRPEPGYGHLMYRQNLDVPLDQDVLQTGMVIDR